MNDGLRIVTAWHEALNSGDADRLVGLSHPEVEMHGPRGTVSGAGVLRGWMARANIRLEPRRLFQSGDTVVVEEDARWISPETGEVVGGGVVASVFVVRGGRVVGVSRHDGLRDALEAAKMDGSHETEGEHHG